MGDPPSTVDLPYVRLLLERGEGPKDPFYFHCPDHALGGDLAVLVADHAATPRERRDYLEHGLVGIFHNFGYVSKYRQIMDVILRHCSIEDLVAMDYLWYITMFSCDIMMHDDELRYLLFHPCVFDRLDPDTAMREDVKNVYPTTRAVYEEFFRAKDTESLRRTAARLDVYREELMAVAWHPSRLLAWCFPDFLDASCQDEVVSAFVA
jgi:hypothetical protein